jgi:hypothetical protein
VRKSGAQVKKEPKSRPEGKSLDAGDAEWLVIPRADVPNRLTVPSAVDGRRPALSAPSSGAAAVAAKYSASRRQTRPETPGPLKARAAPAEAPDNHATPPAARRASSKRAGSNSAGTTTDAHVTRSVDAARDAEPSSLSVAQDRAPPPPEADERDASDDHRAQVLAKALEVCGIPPVPDTCAV